MALEHVADDALVQCCGAGVAHCRCIECFLSEVGQTSHALVIREGVITNQRTSDRPQFVHFHNNPLLAAHRAFILPPYSVCSEAVGAERVKGPEMVVSNAPSVSGA